MACHPDLATLMDLEEGLPDFFITEILLQVGIHINSNSPINRHNDLLTTFRSSGLEHITKIIEHNLLKFMIVILPLPMGISQPLDFVLSFMVTSPLMEELFVEITLFQP